MINGLIQRGEVFLTDDGLWARKCPHCDKLLYYSGKHAKGNAMSHARKSTPCRSCSQCERDRLPTTDPILATQTPLQDVSTPVMAYQTLPTSGVHTPVKMGCTEFRVRCCKCGTLTERKLYPNDWHYNFACAGCGASITFTMVIKPVYETKQRTTPAVTIRPNLTVDGKTLGEPLSNSMARHGVTGWADDMGTEEGDGEVVGSLM